MAYGIIKVDSITFTNGGVDQTVTVSGIVQSISGDITATGTIQGATIIGTSTVSGATVTGTTANFVTVSGTTVTGTTANFGGVITAPTIRGTTTVSGATVTGTTANFATLSGTTITGGHVTTASGTYTGNVTAAAFVPTSNTVPTNGVYLPSANSVALATNGTPRVNFGTGEVVFNDGGEDYDFRIEGDTEANLLFVDASTNRVGVGTSTPRGLVSISNNTTGAGVVDSSVQIGYSTADFYGFRITNSNDPSAQYGGLLKFQRGTGAAWSDAVTISNTGAVGIGTTNPGTALEVALPAGTGTPRVRFDQASDNPYVELQRYSGAVGQHVATRIRSSDNTAGLVFERAASAAIGSQTFNESMRIDSSGTFRVKGAGTAGVNDAVQLNGSAPANSLLLDANGRLLVGTSSARSNYAAYGAALFQTEGANNDGTRAVAITYGKADGGDPIISFGKHRSNSIGGTTIVANNDGLGQLIYSGSDGTNFITAAVVKAEVDGTPGANDMPGRLVFSTCSDGSASPTERMRITSGGYFKASNTGSYISTTSTEHEFNQSAASNSNIVSYASNASFASSTYYAQALRAANSAYFFFIGNSGSGADNEFVLYGDGNGKCDGSWTGGGADYAEYFEWSDGNPDAEDRRGISVVLDGDKIRPALTGEDPFGVISGNPSVVGDSAWNKWSGKYLRDDYGTYIQEDYEVLQWTDEDDNEQTAVAGTPEAEDAPEDATVVIQQRRKLNPAYNPDQEYTSREERPEWDCVGLMGKLRIRKGQPTGNRWIKMRDVSNSVEEWLVR